MLLNKEHFATKENLFQQANDTDVKLKCFVDKYAKLPK